MIAAKEVKKLMDELDNCNFYEPQTLYILNDDLAPLVNIGNKVIIDLNYSGSCSDLMLVAIMNSLHLMRVQKYTDTMKFTDCITGKTHNYNENDSETLPVIIIGKVISIYF